MSNELELDGNGNIRVAPMVQYGTHIVADLFVILRLGYATTEQEFETGNLQQLQLTLTPVQCQALAASLQQAASTIETQSRGNRGN